MTLQEWLDAHPNVRYITQTMRKGSVQVFVAQTDHDLSNLSDYVVSSAVSGPSFVLVPREYVSQSARDAQPMGYGDASYWTYLDTHAQELAATFRARGNHAEAERMLSRSLSESLAGNDGA